MSAEQILTQLRDQDMRLSVTGDRLRVDAPKGAITPELRSMLADHKPELIEALTPTLIYDADLDVLVDPEAMEDPRTRAAIAWANGKSAPNPPLELLPIRLERCQRTTDDL